VTRAYITLQRADLLFLQRTTAGRRGLLHTSAHGRTTGTPSTRTPPRHAHTGTTTNARRRNGTSTAWILRRTTCACTHAAPPSFTYRLRGWRPCTTTAATGALLPLPSIARHLPTTSSLYKHRMVATCKTHAQTGGHAARRAHTWREPRAPPCLGRSP